LLLEEGYAYDVVKAVLAAQGQNPARARNEVSELSQWIKRDDWKQILPAYSRCVRITRSEKANYKVNERDFIHEQERELYSAVLNAQKAVSASQCISTFLNSLLTIIPRINIFFDSVLVMDEDMKIRQNRLGLLQMVSQLAAGIVDLSKLEGF